MTINRAKLTAIPHLRTLPGQEGQRQDHKQMGSRIGDERGSLRVSVVLKDAILYAAEKVGIDGKGTGGLVGYLERIARQDPKTYAKLLQRVVPMHVIADAKQTVIFRSEEEVKAELLRRGINVEHLFPNLKTINIKH